jgi:hypothetical protein
VGQGMGAGYRQQTGCKHGKSNESNNHARKPNP